MKTLLTSAFSIRLRLITSGRSHIPEAWAIKEMNRIEYYLATGNALNIARKNAGVLRVLIPGNFLKEFENKLNGMK